MVAYNFLNQNAGYINTGSWSVKAMKEAKLFGNVHELASSNDKNFNYIPKDYTVSDDLIIYILHQTIQFLGLNFMKFLKLKLTYSLI